MDTKRTRCAPSCSLYISLPTLFPLHPRQTEGILLEPWRQRTEICTRPEEALPRTAAKEGTWASTTSVHRLGTLRGGMEPPAIAYLMSLKLPGRTVEVPWDAGGRSVGRNPRRINGPQLCCCLIPDSPEVAAPHQFPRVRPKEGQAREQVHLKSQL